jgi:hypothetical protein
MSVPIGIVNVKLNDDGVWVANVAIEENESGDPLYSFFQQVGLTREEAVDALLLMVQSAVVDLPEEIKKLTEKIEKAKVRNKKLKDWLVMTRECDG